MSLRELLGLSVEARRLFDIVADHRMIKFHDLLKETGLNADEVVEPLQKLKEADLIESVSAEVADFKTFYLTSEGLSTRRALRQHA